LSVDVGKADRLTHHISILKMNGDSYRLAQSQARKTKTEA
jgi:hypothetical protein